MKKTAALLLAALLMLAHPARAAAEGISIDSASASISESFNAMGFSPTAALPTGWRMGIDSNYALAKNTTTKSAGTAGDGVLDANSDGGFYNFADGENFISTDRAVGFLSDAFTTQSKNLFLGLQNISGSTITELSLSYDIEKYRTGIRSADIRLLYSYDNLIWSEIADAAQHYNIDPATAVLNPPTSINKSVSLNNLNIPHDSNFYFRWTYTVNITNNCQALGIDNFQLNIGPLQQPDLQWDGPSGAAWDAASPTWKNSAGGHVIWNDNMPNNATFADGGANVATTINLISPRTAGRLTFDAGSKTYTLSGSSLQIRGASAMGIVAHSDAVIQSAIQVGSSQTWDISSNVSTSGGLILGANAILTKKGTGNLVLSGPQTHGANSQIKMTEGTLHLAANLGNTARLLIQGNTNNSNATVFLDADQDLSALSISTADPGHQGLDLSSLASPAAFRSLRVHAADLALAKANLYTLIRQARLTPGDGIFDSSLASHLNSTVGIAQISDSILIRPTRIGDVNLDGRVTIADFIDLASNFGHIGVTWQEGDLNYDGLVTISDFIDLASNFGGTYAGDASPITSVPEPTFLLLLLPASLATLRPRRLQFSK